MHVAPHCKNTKPYHCCFKSQEQKTSPPLLHIAKVKSHLHCSKSQINHFTIVVPNHKHKHKASPPFPKEKQDTRSNTNNYQFQYVFKFDSYYFPSSHLHLPFCHSCPTQARNPLNCLLYGLLAKIIMIIFGCSFLQAKSGDGWKLESKWNGSMGFKKKL